MVRRMEASSEEVKWKHNPSSQAGYKLWSCRRGCGTVDDDPWTSVHSYYSHIHRCCLCKSWSARSCEIYYFLLIGKRIVRLICSWFAQGVHKVHKVQQKAPSTETIINVLLDWLQPWPLFDQLKFCTSLLCMADWPRPPPISHSHRRSIDHGNRMDKKIAVWSPSAGLIPGKKSFHKIIYIRTPLSLLKTLAFSCIDRPPTDTISCEYFAFCHHNCNLCIRNPILQWD